jgi:hypothetical protein
MNERAGRWVSVYALSLTRRNTHTEFGSLRDDCIQPASFAPLDRFFGGTASPGRIALARARAAFSSSVVVRNQLEGSSPKFGRAIAGDRPARHGNSSW